MRHWDEYQFGYFILMMRDNQEVVGIADLSIVQFINNSFLMRIIESFHRILV
ncbi:hypothetical protein ACUW94_000480 [Staphylococcus epidermidis]